MGLKSYAEDGRLYDSAMERAEELERAQAREGQQLCKTPETTAPTKLRIVLEIEDPQTQLPSLLATLRSSLLTPAAPVLAPRGCWSTGQ